MDKQNLIGETTERLSKEDNRFVLVNSIAQRAKKILSQNEHRSLSTGEISHHRAIYDAIQQIESDKDEKATVTEVIS